MAKPSYCLPLTYCKKSCSNFLQTSFFLDSQQRHLKTQEWKRRKLCFSVLFVAIFVCFACKVVTERAHKLLLHVPIDFIHSLVQCSALRIQNSNHIEINFNIGKHKTSSSGVCIVISIWDFVMEFSNKLISPLIPFNGFGNNNFGTFFSADIRNELMSD